MNKQCICPECGAIAEVRRRKNGQRLRYMHCINGHGGLGNAKQAAELEAIEQDSIGILGELPQNNAQDETAPTIPEKESAKPIELEKDEKKPSEAGVINEQLSALQDDTPEINENQKQPPQYENNSMLTVAALGIVGLVFGAGIYLRVKEGIK